MGSLTLLHSLVVTLGSGFECITTPCFVAPASLGLVRRDCVKRTVHKSENGSLYQLSVISHELNKFRLL